MIEISSNHDREHDLTCIMLSIVLTVSAFADTLQMLTNTCAAIEKFYTFTYHKNMSRAWCPRGIGFRQKFLHDILCNESEL